MNFKTETRGLLLRYIKSRFCRTVLHKRHGQLGFHFLIPYTIFKHGKELESFIFCATKTQTFVDNKDIVSVSYLTVFRFMAYNSSSALKSYDIASSNLKFSHNIVRDMP